MTTGKAMSGVLIVPTPLPLAVALDVLALIAIASVAAEWDRVVYIPLR